MYTVHHGNVLMFCLWFPSEREPRSRSSRKPLKNQRRKPSTTFSCHDGNHTKNQRRKPVLKAPPQQKNRGITRDVL